MTPSLSSVVSCKETSYVKDPVSYESKKLKCFLISTLSHSLVSLSSDIPARTWGKVEVGGLGVTGT